MTDLITELTERIEDYRKVNKNPCKNYATRAAAVRATEMAARNVGVQFNKNQDMNAERARYTVFYIEAWGRWVGAIDMTELLRRPTSTGGYLGIEPDFFKY